MLPSESAAAKAEAAQQLMEETRAAAEDARGRANKAKPQREDLRLRAEVCSLLNFCGQPGEGLIGWKICKATGM